MSRAINVTVTIPEAMALCRKHGRAFSAIEALPSGGTRVVMLSADAATAMSAAFGKKVLKGHVERSPLRGGGR